MTKPLTPVFKAARTLARIQKQAEGLSEMLAGAPVKLANSTNGTETLLSLCDFASEQATMISMDVEAFSKSILPTLEALPAGFAPAPVLVRQLPIGDRLAQRSIMALKNYFEGAGFVYEQPSEADLLSWDGKEYVALGNATGHLGVISISSTGRVRYLNLVPAAIHAAIFNHANPTSSFPYPV